MKTRRLIALLVIATVASLGAIRTSLAARNNFAPIPQVTSIPMLPGTTQPINVTRGDQTNPHVACNVMTYTDDDLEGTSLIKYLDFATNLELSLLGTNIDRLAETDGQRIAYNVLGPSGDVIFIYDLTAQTITPIPIANAINPAIGGDLVAFLHGTSSTAMEVAVYEQTPRTTTQLTNDGLLNRNPAVSPDGKVVVWEKCQANGTGCDIYSATQTGPGAFTTRRLTGAGEDESPDTNGQIITYISDKSGENDIYFQRVDGSNEMHIALPGDQRDVRISGNLLVFESKTGIWYDVFLYDLSSARVYQVTNTPDTGEGLSDVVAGCNGLNRIVYTAPGPFGDYDVYAFNFQLPDSITDQLNDLTEIVQSLDLHDGIEASLRSKLQDALAAINNSATGTACDSLTAFINASQAQSGKKLTAAQVQQLVEAAAEIKSDLGCQ
jgi:Tol biopolymer transport system component